MAYALAPADKKWTRAEALAERNRMVDNEDFRAGYASGDSEHVRHFNEVTKACIGTPDNYQPLPPAGGRYHDHLGHQVGEDNPTRVP